MNDSDKTWTKEDLDIALRLFQAYWPTAQVPRHYNAVTDTMIELIEIAQKLKPRT